MANKEVHRRWVSVKSRRVQKKQRSLIKWKEEKKQRERFDESDCVRVKGKYRERGSVEGTIGWVHIIKKEKSMEKSAREVLKDWKVGADV